MGITPSSGISRAAHAAINHSGMPGVGNARSMSGSYVGNGVGSREINLGGRAIGGFVLGSEAGGVNIVWLVIKGAELMFAAPYISVRNLAVSIVQNEPVSDVISSANGFTLAAAAPFHNNVNLNVYYFAVWVVIP